MVPILGSTAVVGSPGQTSPGAAHVFVRSGTAWSQQAKLTASDGASRDLFGGSVDISRSTDCGRYMIRRPGPRPFSLSRHTRDNRCGGPAAHWLDPPGRSAVRQLAQP